MQKLKIQVEILTSEDHKDTILKTKVWLRKPFVTPQKTDREELLIHSSENTFDFTQDQELEHILAATGDIITASMKLHGETFGV